MSRRLNPATGNFLRGIGSARSTSKLDALVEENILLADTVKRYKEEQIELHQTFGIKPGPLPTLPRVASAIFAFHVPLILGAILPTFGVGLAILGLVGHLVAYRIDNPLAKLAANVYTVLTIHGFILVSLLQ